MTATLYTEDPAVAGAMGRCLTARSIDPKRLTRAHPRTCGWCDFPTSELRAGLDGFLAWAGFDDRAGTSSRHATRAFTHDLHREEQDALITAAQVLVDEAPVEPQPTLQPAAPAATKPAEPLQSAPAEDEVPSWLA